MFIFFTTVDLDDNIGLILNISGRKKGRKQGKKEGKEAGR